MRSGAVKVESAGSFWWLDDATMEYMRLPKEERPRDRPEWGGPAAGNLQDAVWHPMTGWRIGQRPIPDRGELHDAYYRQVGDDLIAAMLTNSHIAALKQESHGLMIDTPGDPPETIWAPDARLVT